MEQGPSMQLTVLGSGDAFGSGGRLQTCYHVATPEQDFLIDCGATAMIAMNGLGLDPNRVAVIIISHLHGDHFSGLVWWMLHADHVAKRTCPLDIVGPEGTGARFRAAAEVLFPGSYARKRGYEIRIHEMKAREPVSIAGIDIEAYAVIHPSGAPSHALRIAHNGSLIAFTGDTEWLDDLIEVADGADLFISECYGYQRQTRYHLTWKILCENIERLRAKQIMLTHMSSEMLEQAAGVIGERVLIAEDGLKIEIA